ncbi:hypothetical protein [Chondromyces apiculatus]|uniref:Uncharacterized protein n=1 Tax=Chondromyces apiculatus DSM 436 TaxID=1192034 RepID=A0A017TEU9_9BACT|nr:hypothetical protein [Chondromyces apiculatus]EYF07823.1 Hypothetical protein CAP_6845 [Chondromyces apiculatus DSM 436]
MAARTLDPRNALLTLFPQVGYTLQRLKAHPVGTPHVAIFEGLRAEGLDVLTRELEIIDAQTEAQARVDMANSNLDAFAGRLAKAVLTLVNDDREHSFYVHYFRNKTLKEFKRPVLGAKLVSMRGWVRSLEESNLPTLHALAPELTALVQAADAAVQAREHAQATNRIFRYTGARAQWVDRVNAARKVLHGTLAQLPHQQLGLPPDFADQFFLKEQKREVTEEEETVASMQVTIARQREELAASELRLKELEEDAEAAKKAAEARAAKLAQLTELERVMQAMAKQHAALTEALDAEA